MDVDMALKGRSLADFLAAEWHLRMPKHWVQGQLFHLFLEKQSKISSSPVRCAVCRILYHALKMCSDDMSHISGGSGLEDVLAAHCAKLLSSCTVETRVAYSQKLERLFPEAFVREKHAPFQRFLVFFRDDDESLSHPERLIARWPGIGRLEEFLDGKTVDQMVRAKPQSRRKLLLPNSAKEEGDPAGALLSTASFYVEAAEQILRNEIVLSRSESHRLRGKLDRPTSAIQLAQLLDRARLIEENERLQMQADELKEKLATAVAEQVTLKQQMDELVTQQQAAVDRFMTRNRSTELNSPITTEKPPVEIAHQPGSLTASGRQLIDEIRQMRGLDFAQGTESRAVVDSLLNIMKPAVRVISQDIYTSTRRCFF